MSSSAEYSSLFSVPIMALQYRDMAGHLHRDSMLQPEYGTAFAEATSTCVAEVQLSETEFAERITRERAEAAFEAEQKLRREYEQKLLAARASISTMITGFEDQRNDYFARVESEVVQLALAIAGKILHREAQVDPMLLATLVRMAIEKMREGSAVTLRVSLGRGGSWKNYFAELPNMSHVEVIEDALLSAQDCVLETELGLANFGLDTQLKEVEQGFFDLLALRPANR